MIILGVDPGKKGCLCVFDGVKPEFLDTPVYGLEKTTKYDLPEISGRMFSLASKYGHTYTTPTIRAVIEGVNPHPKEGVVSAKTSGYGEGMWHTLFTVFGIPYEVVSSQKWQRFFGLIGADKTAAIAIAKQKFPSVNLIRSRARTEDHNRADSLLIALWGWEKKSK